MKKQKTIVISLETAKTLERMLDRLETLECSDCPGNQHLDSCPAQRVFQLRNVLTQRINNPDRWRDE